MIQEKLIAFHAELCRKHEDAVQAHKRARAECKHDDAIRALEASRVLHMVATDVDAIIKNKER